MRDAMQIAGAPGEGMAFSAPVPTYALYGETGEDPALELMHCESIPERSRLHDWEIRPHRHDLLFQVLFMRKGAVKAVIDGRDYSLEGPVVLTMPPMAVHGFAFSEDVDGWVITMADVRLAEVLQSEPDLAAFLGRPHLLPIAPGSAAHARIDGLFGAVTEEFAGDAMGRYGMLRASLAQIFIQVGRQLLANARGEVGIGGGKARHVHAFRARVESRYRDGLTVRDYAHDLGITPVQLNRLCREFLGKSALRVIHDRLLLEAKRDLIYTSMAVAEIGYSLGFNDPAYFSRFFARLTGSAPSAFRRRAQRAMGPGGA